ncbi:Uncharacterised protein [Mycobacteroides abscessus]|nr:Uncharacterised protein [Mycobacteroides abscessus]
MRDAATTTATSVPVAALADRAASSTISTAGVMPPTNGAYDVGSTWISSRPDPSAASSCAASSTMRRMSASDRTHARAASYRRWNRNQPRSVGGRRSGSPSTSAWGSRTPYCAARSRNVSGRMDPVKCRCRWAFGSVARSRTAGVCHGRPAPAVGRGTTAAQVPPQFGVPTAPARVMPRGGTRAASRPSRRRCGRPRRAWRRPAAGASSRSPRR